MKRSFGVIVRAAWCTVLVGMAVEKVQGATRFYRTTAAQDFREVVNADWGTETGPGAMVIDLDAAVERQTFRGLGGSFAEASCFTLMRLPKEKTRRGI